MLDEDTTESDVAVVIPVFNTGDHLLEAVASVRAQTVPCEIVIVDDGSTDALTLEIVASLESSARVLTQPNAGAAAARNTGIRHTRARYVLPVDADDRIEPTYVEQARRVMDSSPEVGIVYCRAARFGSVSGPWVLPDFSRELMAADNIIFISAMFRRADWVSVGGFDESLRVGGEDWDFWLSLLDLGREVHQLPETLFHYRISEESSERSFRRDDLVDLYSSVFRKHERFFLEHIEALYRQRFSLEDELARRGGTPGRGRRLLKRLAGTKH